MTGVIHDRSLASQFLCGCVLRSLRGSIRILESVLHHGRGEYNHGKYDLLCGEAFTPA